MIACFAYGFPETLKYDVAKVDVSAKKVETIMMRIKMASYRVSGLYTKTAD